MFASSLLLENCNINLKKNLLCLETKFERLIISYSKIVSSITFNTFWKMFSIVNEAFSEAFLKTDYRTAATLYRRNQQIMDIKKRRFSGRTSVLAKHVKLVKFFAKYFFLSYETIDHVRR